MIGQRVPVINNSVTPTGSGTSVVTGSVQYVDVGLTLTVEPTVHLDDTIAIKVDLEVSNVIQEIFNSTSGTLAYQIGTRNATTLLQLRNGETQVLAGLIQNIDRASSNSVPGLGDMPIIGRLFSTNKDDREETEIVLSITPRVIRSQPRAASDVTEFWFGTEKSMRSSPLAATSNATGRSTAAQPTGSGGMDAANRNSFAPDAATSEEDDSDAGGTPERVSLTWDGPGQVSEGQEFTVTLRVDSPAALKSLRSQIRYDQAVLELLAAEVGDFVPPGIRSSVIPEVRERGGRAALNIQDLGDPPATGSGSLLVLRFRSTAARPSTMISLQQFAASGTDGLMVPVIAPRPMTIVATP
jgi:general secretion pathway protein D